MHAVTDRLPPRARQRLFQALSPLAALWPQLANLLRGVTKPSSSASTERRVQRPPSDGPVTTWQIEILRSSSDFAERARTARSLTSAASGEALAALAAALRDRSVEVAVEAALALGYHDREMAVPVLRDVVEGGDGYFNPIVRAAAIRSLGMLLPQGHGDVLVGAVSSVDGEVSIAAIATLIERGEPKSAIKLLEVLEDRSGFYLPVVRKAAAEGLSTLGFHDDTRLRPLMEAENDADISRTLNALVNRASRPLF